MSEHGTRASYEQHRLAGEPACDDCRAAAAEYQRSYRRRTIHQPYIERARAEGYAAGVAAAREAVAAQMDAAINVCGECTDVALAAIDALTKEDK